MSRRELAVDVVRAAAGRAGRPGGAGTCAVYSPGLGSLRHGAKSEAVRRESALRGYDFVRFDLFGHGDSAGALRDVTVTGAVADLVGVIGDDEARAESAQRPPRRLVLAGASFGGYVSLLAASQLSVPVKAVVLFGAALNFRDWISGCPRDGDAQSGDVLVDSAYCGRMRFSSRLVADAQRHASVSELAAAHRATKLIIVHGEADVVAPVRDARRLLALNCNPASRLLVVPADRGGDHRLSAALEAHVAPFLKESLSS